jgi:hypothetical protein
MGMERRGEGPQKRAPGEVVFIDGERAGRGSLGNDDSGGPPMVEGKAKGPARREDDGHDGVG